MVAYTFFRHAANGRVPMFHIEDCENHEQALESARKCLRDNPRYKRIEVFEGDNAVAWVERNPES